MKKEVDSKKRQNAERWLSLIEEISSHPPLRAGSYGFCDMEGEASDWRKLRDALAQYAQLSGRPHPDC